MYEDPFAPDAIKDPNSDYYWSYNRINKRAQDPLDKPVDPFWQQMAQGGAKAGSQMPAVGDPSNAEASRMFQQSAIQDLHGVATGRTHPAVDALRRGAAQASALASSAGGAMRGRGAGAAMRSIDAQQAGIAAGANAQAGILQMQEQQAAQQALFQALQGMRSQDAGMAEQQAGTVLNARQMDDQYRQGMIGAGLGQSIGQGQFGMNRARINQGLTQNDVALQRDFFNSLLQGGATALEAASRMPGSGGRQEIEDAFNGRG